MQIRIGNKQDEKSVRELISEILLERGESLDLEGRDRDLRQIEIHYFGHDGVFLVAEDDRKVFAFAAAAKHTETACELKRLYVRQDHRRQGIGTQLLQQVISFARNLDYQELVVTDSLVDADASRFLLTKGFSSTTAGLVVKL